jgi:hypothetical protein
LAPTANRRPISRVRSVTDTNMMFTIPRSDLVVSEKWICMNLRGSRQGRERP